MGFLTPIEAAKSASGRRGWGVGTWLLVLSWIWALHPALVSARPPANAGADDAALAQEAYVRGDFGRAVQLWRGAVEAAARTKDLGPQLDAMIKLAGAYHASGQVRLAEDTLDEARELAVKAGDEGREAAIYNARGAIRIFSHKAQFAEDDLKRALELALQEKDPGLEAVVRNNLGILFSAEDKYSEAEEAYRAAAALTDDAVLAAKAKGNEAETACLRGDYAGALTVNEAAAAAAKRLSDSHNKAFCLMHAGRNLEMLFERVPEPRQEWRLSALELYEEAARIAEASKDKPALSFALGYCGHLYEQEKKYESATQLTRRAVFLAQEARAPDILYQWEWQNGRIEAAEGRGEDAIVTYRRAIQELDAVRDGISTRFGNENAHGSFREKAGPMYFELADLLLQRANGMESGKELQKCLEDARGTCEMLKAVELEDYFQDDCVNLLKSKTKAVETISPTSAIIYLIPLKDRTEIIVSVNGRLQRVKAPVGVEELTAEVRSFRLHLEKRITNEYMDEAQQLYTWLILPLEPLLEKEKVDTLVFVPDGALRTVPMAALQDGKKFLIEKYAVAVTPGLTLMEPGAGGLKKIAMMTNALTKGVQRDGQNFPPLPYAAEEVANLRSMYGGTTLMDESFIAKNLNAKFDAQPYSVVHIASHGEFNGNSRATFLLTYDSKLHLDDLEHLIRPAQLRDQPLELLSLSACQTAAGDDRAALGLAGVAVKAGARSAFATLWCVNDEASTELVTAFYQSLLTQPNISKAKALQQAQVKLLSQPRTSHPCLWAPYLIIGNWM